MPFSRKILCLLVIFSCIDVQECKGLKARGYGGDGPPVQCKKVDCPTFNIIHSEKEFEIRNYSKSLWVTGPSIDGPSFMGGFAVGQSILFEYYARGNDQGVLIFDHYDPGAVLMLDVSNSTALKSTYKVYYYVPNKYQNGGLPKPLKSNIKQVELPKYKYAAVRRVDGEIIEDIILGQVDELRKQLKGTSYNRAADRDEFTFIIYGEGKYQQGRIDVEDAPRYALWLVGKAIWGVLSTNTPDFIPFGYPASFSDVGTGYSYFFLSLLDPVGSAATQDVRVSLAISEVYVDDGCDGIDVQSPKCPKITISGKLQKIPARSRGIREERALFKAHLGFARFSKTNESFDVYKLDILRLFLVIQSGPKRDLTVDSYLYVE